jgi:hypothetical protein
LQAVPALPHRAADCASNGTQVDWSQHPEGQLASSQVDSEEGAVAAQEESAAKAASGRSRSSREKDSSFVFMARSRNSRLGLRMHRSAKPNQLAQPSP